MTNSWLRQFAVITPTSETGYEAKSARRRARSAYAPASGTNNFADDGLSGATALSNAGIRYNCCMFVMGLSA